MANAVATIQQKQVALVNYFEERKADFSSMMESPAHVEKFMRVMKNALIRDPKVAEASTQSVFLECQKCAADGLVLDGREAVLTRFKTNQRRQVGGKWEDNWVTAVVYIPMIKGLTKLVNGSPEIADWHTGLVYEAEYEQGKFMYHAGDTPKLKHEPIIVGERGPVVAAYSVARLRSGIVKIEVMTRGQLDGIKARTKSKKGDKITGPWATDEEEMFRKTVARRHFKSLPLSEKATNASERIDGLYDFRPGEDIEDIEPIEKPAAVANKRKTSAAAKMAAATKDDPADDDPAGDGEKTIDHDPETGEVADDTGDNPAADYDPEKDDF
jgi:recombination protein RecT